MRLLEPLDLGVRPARYGRRRRAQHDQMLRDGKRRLDFAAKIAGRGKVMLVAKDRRQALRHDTVRRQLAGERARDSEPLELTVQPVGELLVLVAVAEERIIAR